MSKKRPSSRVKPGITDLWYRGFERSSRYGRKGPGGGPDPHRYLARWKPPHATEQSKTFATVGDAERWLRNQRTAHDSGEWLRPERSKVTVAQLHEEWWPRHQKVGTRGRPLKPNTVTGYDQVWRLLIEPRLGRKPVGTLRPRHISAWVAELLAAGYSPSRVRKAHRVLSLMLDHAVHEDRIRVNPARGARLPSMTTRSTLAPLSTGEVAVLAQHVADAQEPRQEQYATLVLFLAATGVRIGEAASLRVRDLVLDNREGGELAPLVHVRRTQYGKADENGVDEGLPKSGKARMVAMPADLADAMKALTRGRKPGDRVFTGPRGGTLHYSNWSRRYWAPGVEKLGKPEVTPHGLRHVAATAMAHREIPLAVIANQLGHASPDITAKVYSHLFEDSLAMVGRAMMGAFQAPASASDSEPRRNGGPDLKAV